MGHRKSVEVGGAGAVLRTGMRRTSYRAVSGPKAGAPQKKLAGYRNSEECQAELLVLEYTLK
jgi:hypothetical protein